MKRRVLKGKTLFIFCLAVYILAVAVSVGSTVSSIYRSNSNLFRIAEGDLRFYEETGAFSKSAIDNGVNNFVYSPDLERLDYISGYDAERRFDFDSYARSLDRRLGSGERIYELKFSLDLTSHIAVAAAFRMQDGGLFLFLKELPSANSALTRLVLSIAVVSLFSVVYLCLILRKNRAVERMQREYIDNINHELKTPIASVKALAEPIHDGLVHDEDALRRYSGIMLSELSALERTVSDMLELSRIRSRQSAPELENAAAERVFGDVLGKYSVLCGDFGLSFSVSPPLSDWPQLRTAPAMAARMLEILLDNAVKFTGESGSIAVALKTERRRAVIGVTNDGPPIPRDERRRIFERFYQGNRSRGGRGSGLGLSIARGLAECLDEQVWLERSVPGATEFCFSVKTK